MDSHWHTLCHTMPCHAIVQIIYKSLFTVINRRIDMINIHNRQRTHSSIQHINAPFEIQTNFTFSNPTLFCEGRTNGLLTLCCKTFKQFSFKIYIVFFCWIMSKSLVFHLLQIMCCDAAKHRKPQCIEEADIDVYLEMQMDSKFKEFKWRVCHQDYLRFFSENFRLCFSFR